jgi:seryl-tRNA synthetase
VSKELRAQLEALQVQEKELQARLTVEDQNLSTAQQALEKATAFHRKTEGELEALYAEFEKMRGFLANLPRRSAPSVPPPKVEDNNGLTVALQIGLVALVLIAVCSRN